MTFQSWDNKSKASTLSTFIWSEVSGKSAQRVSFTYYREARPGQVSFRKEWCTRERSTGQNSYQTRRDEVLTQETRRVLQSYSQGHFSLPTKKGARQTDELHVEVEKEEGTNEKKDWRTLVSSNELYHSRREEFVPMLEKCETIWGGQLTAGLLQTLTLNLWLITYSGLKLIHIKEDPRKKSWKGRNEAYSRQAWTNFLENARVLSALHTNAGH